MHAEVNQPVLQGIRDLQLSGLQLTCVPGEIALCTGVRELNLCNNRLTALPEEVFNGLVALQKLWLGNNRLVYLPERIFQGLASLRHLHLVGNWLITLPQGLFQGLTTLQGLMLQNNPQLMIHLVDTIIPDFDQINFVQTMRTFFSYAPESLLAGLYQLAAGTPLTVGCPTPVAVQRAFAQLPETMRNAIFRCVWEEAGRPNTRDPRWGEYHAFDFMLIFCRALKRYVKTTLANLSNAQKNDIYWQVYRLALAEPGAEAVNFNDSNLLGEWQAREHILLLIDLMMRLQR
jgi:Leucine-rich repeat (LRR) protein